MDMESKMERLVTTDGDLKITCIGLHERYIVLGHEDGSVSSWYLKNGAKMMSAKVSDDKIVGVGCESQAKDGAVIIYVAVTSGSIVTLSQKGISLFMNINTKMKHIGDKIAGTQLKDCKVLGLIYNGKYSIEVFTSKGTMIFTGCNKVYRTKSFLNIPYILLTDYSLKKRNGDPENGDIVPFYKYNSEGVASLQYSWGMEIVDTEIVVFVTFDEKIHSKDDVPTEFTVTSKNITRYVRTYNSTPSEEIATNYTYIHF